MPALSEPCFAGFIPCPNCDGNGAIEIADTTYSRWHLDPPGSHYEPCEYCDGTGTVEEDAPQIDEDEREFADPTVAA